MATQRHPILVWNDRSGATTAVLVSDIENGAHGATADEAMHSLKELLEWRLEHQPWSIDADFLEPVLTDINVEVRPQYSEKRRLLPCPETVWLRVPCVTGRQENGLLVASVPHLGLRFNYQDVPALKSLATHYIKEALHGLTPAQLLERMPPRNCRLAELVLRQPTFESRELPPHERDELKVLFAVAEPLLHDAGRKRMSSAAFGRENLAQQLIDRLRRDKASLLLVGEPGVGKSTLLLDAVRKLARAKSGASGSSESEDDQSLAAYRWWRGSASRLIAGMRYLGEWEERCEEFIEQLAAVEGVFCAENLLELVQVGGQGAGDSVAAFLLPYLQRGELRIVTEATPAEVAACRRLLPGFLDAFQVLPVPPFGDGEAIQVLGRIVNAYASAAKLDVDPAVAPLVHGLFHRFQPYNAFPGAAARFLRALVTELKTRARDVRTLNAAAVVQRFVKETGLPEVFLRDDLPLSFESVRGHLDSLIIGQPAATAAVARVITTIKAGLTDPGRPFGVLLFCGPTGVGKTALAKAMSDFCFGAGTQANRLVRLDMSEYGSWGAATRLLETAKGTPAPWIERVRSQPFAVVLFDEIEKAAPEVFDVLLRLLDEGVLTDRFGRVTQFRSAILILTSNLGATTRDSAGFGATNGPAYESEVAKFFRPEFFNRLDAVVTFNPLSFSDVERIARKELSDLAVREGFSSSGIQLDWTNDVVALVARAGYDHRFGARPLQRALDQLVVTPLARWRVENPLVRNVRLQISVGGEPAGIMVTAREL